MEMPTASSRVCIFELNQYEIVARGITISMYTTFTRSGFLDLNRDSRPHRYYDLS